MEESTDDKLTEFERGWNKALEKAAKICDVTANWDGQCAEKIRSLKRGSK